MFLNPEGQLAQEIWKELPTRFPQIRLDGFIFMPNHMHGIIQILETNYTAPKGPVPLWEIVASYKRGAKTRILASEGEPWFAWQYRFWPKVLYNQRILNHARQYIIDNPANWERDLHFKLPKSASRNYKYQS